MAFVKRRIELDFSMGGSSTTVSGLRTSVKIANAGTPSMAAADVTIYGLPLQMMNQLSTVGTQYNQIGKNSITIRAGDDQGNMPLVFKGTIDAAFVDAQAMPGVAFHVAAHAGAYEAVASTEPTSVSGSADVAQIIQQIAQKAGLQFENNGVSVKVSNPYLPGTAREQILNIARAAGIQWTIENGTVAIWKTGQTRQGSDVEVSPETGMVGYPAFSQSNIVVRTLFNSELRYGGPINLKSDIRPACGRWGIVNISHDLESEMLNGQWFSTIQATTVGGGIAPGGAGV